MPSNWTKEMERRLREMWKSRVPTAVIGERLGVTKNAVIGKAHRLHLRNRGDEASPRRTDLDHAIWLASSGRMTVAEACRTTGTKQTDVGPKVWRTLRGMRKPVQSGGKRA